MRSALAAKLFTLGSQLSDLRSEFVNANYTFLAGMVRAAEEVLVIVLKSLNDPAIAEEEL